MSEDINKPNTWPGGVTEMTIGHMARLGVGQDGFLYWDGKKLQTETRLATFERVLGIAVAVSTLVVASIESIRLYIELCTS